MIQNLIAPSKDFRLPLLRAQATFFPRRQKYTRCALKWIFRIPRVVDSFYDAWFYIPHPKYILLRSRHWEVLCHHQPQHSTRRRGQPQDNQYSDRVRQAMELSLESSSNLQQIATAPKVHSIHLDCRLEIPATRSLLIVHLISSGRFLFLA